MPSGGLLAGTPGRRGPSASARKERAVEPPTPDWGLPDRPSGAAGTSPEALAGPEEPNREAARKAPEELSDCHTGQQVEDDEALLNVEQVAAMLNVRRKRVYELGIPCVRLSPMTIRWCRSDVLAWVASRRTGR